MKFKLFCLITLIVFMFCSSGFSQKWNWLVNGSAGQFYSSSSRYSDSDYKTIKFSGRLSYSQRIKNDLFRFQVKLKPEIFAGYNGFLKQTFILRSNYKKKYKKSIFNLSFYYSKQIFDIEDVRNIYDYTNLELMHYMTISSKLKLISMTRFGYANSENNNPYKIKIPNFSVYSDYYITSNLHVKSGLYFEYFNHSFINENYFYVDPAELERTYQETKTGPDVEIIYSSNYIMKFSYTTLKVFPQNKNNNFYEQGFTGLISFNFLKKWDAMLFAAYYIKHLDKEDSLNTKYLPINSENKIHLKISYNFSRSKNIFIKTGYFNDRLIEDSDVFSGLQGSVGVELRK